MINFKGFIYSKAIYKLGVMQFLSSAFSLTFSSQISVANSQHSTSEIASLK